MNLWQKIYEHMQKHPLQTISEGKKTMTYAEVLKFVHGFSVRLQNERCCAIRCGSEMSAALALLSCFAAGVTAVPLSDRYGEVHCQKILNTIDPACVITDENGDLCLHHFEEAAYCEPKPRPALIMCTSGTTGKPKGVMLTQENILTNVWDICEYFAIDCTDTILISRSLYHCAVLTGEFLVALFKGTNIVFCSERFNPMKLITMMQQLQVTVFGATPTLIGTLVRFMREEHRILLKHLVISGECLNEIVGKQIREAFPDTKIYHVYGLTEACPRVAYMPPHFFDKAPDYVGIPLPSVQIEIRNKKGQLVPINEEGMLWIRGNNVMAGYYNDPKQTSKVFQNGWLCTGDIVSQNERGWLKIKGRADELIIRAGMNIYPQEIEEVLKKDKRVHEVMVYGYDIHPRFSTQIGMLISGDFNDTQEVWDICRKKLPSYQIPSTIELVKQIPKNASGKLLRRNLRGGI